MGALTLKAVTKSFGTTEVIKGVDLEVADGEFCVFVGPSGCGKSTLLRIIAGLEDATSGDIQIDGKRVNATAPADREIAMVFQSYALYPHMSVAANMAYGLKLRNMPKDLVTPESVSDPIRGGPAGRSGRSRRRRGRRAGRRRRRRGGG